MLFSLLINVKMLTVVGILTFMSRKQFHAQLSRGVLLIWIIVGQGPNVLAVGAVGVVWTFFPFSVFFCFLSPSLWETARYRLKYCLKRPLSLKQPTN